MSRYPWLNMFTLPLARVNTLPSASCSAMALKSADHSCGSTSHALLMSMDEKSAPPES